MIPRSGWILSIISILVSIISISVTIYLLWDSIQVVLDLSHSYSQSFISTALALLFFRKGAKVKLILLLDFLGFIVTQAFNVLRYLLLGTLSDDEFNVLQVEFTYFIAPKLFFIICCQSEFCIYETSIWILWFGYVLFMRMLHQLVVIRDRRLYSEETSPAVSSIRLKLLLLLIALQIGFLLVTHLLWSVFTEVPYKPKIVCALDVISGSTPIISSIVKLSSTLVDPTNTSKTILDGVESIVVQAVRVLSFLHLWFLHGFFSPMGFAVAYCISCSYESLCEFQEFLKVLKRINKRINKFPSTQKTELCTICQYPLNDGKLLPCKHAFHKDCLEAWLRMKRECPNCRHSISLEDGDIDNPGSENPPPTNPPATEEQAGDRPTTAPPGNSDGGASLSEISVLTARYGFTLCIDLFSLITPLHIGFVYERQRPAVLSRITNRNRRSNDQDRAGSPSLHAENTASNTTPSSPAGASHSEPPASIEPTNDSSSQIEFNYPSCFRCRYYSEEVEEEATFNEIANNDAEIIFEA